MPDFFIYAVQNPKVPYDKIEWLQWTKVAKSNRTGSPISTVFPDWLWSINSTSVSSIGKEHNN